MKWKKLGKIFCPERETEWMYSHAANPSIGYICGNIARIYFSTRDPANRSSAAWVEVDLRAPQQVIRVAQRPALSPGLIGCFDDSGCSIGCIVNEGGQLKLYYMGWNLGVTVPWRNAIGLAVSSDEGETFERVSIAPILDRSEIDPYTLSYPWVLEDEGQWHMWYGSNTTWGSTPSDMFHIIKDAFSRDGRTWRRSGDVVIRPSVGEYAFARPCVAKDPDQYRMWYAFRGEAYRIGYAESKDGLVWIRKDEDVGIGPSYSGWDATSIEYPCVFNNGKDRYMLYCGESYGKTGFGLAILEQD